jgi:hypothetical protein
MRGQMRPVLFECQTRLSFLREGLIANGISDCDIILVDCDDKSRAHRLTVNRNQPDLASPEMMNWAAYPRREAMYAGCEVVDTSDISLDASVKLVCSRLAARTRRVPLRETPNRQRPAIGIRALDHCVGAPAAAGPPNKSCSLITLSSVILSTRTSSSSTFRPPSALRSPAVASSGHDGIAR